MATKPSKPRSREKDDVRKAPESGDPQKQDLHPGNPATGGDNVRYAPESGDRTRESARRK